MEGDNTSPTLPHNMPETEPALDPPIIMTSIDGHTDAEIKETASSKYATSGNEKSVISGDTVDHPISPKTSIPPRRYQYNRKDENDFHHYINKAHTCVRQGITLLPNNTEADSNIRTGHPVTSSDKDKDLVKLSEMVSQMTHLLAASGVVRQSPDTC
jgi:hypothetical protein